MVQQSVSPAKRDRALEAVFRLRSARGWIYRLAACPQELPLLPARAWFVQTVARTCTWTVRPSDRRHPAPSRLPGVPPVIRKSLQARPRRGHPHPAPRCVTFATRPSPELDKCSLYVPRIDVKRYRNDILKSLFSENQNEMNQRNLRPPAPDWAALSMGTRAELNCTKGCYPVNL